MLKKDVKVGGEYITRVSNRMVTVRVDRIEMDGVRSTYRRRGTRYCCTNLNTGREVVVRSATVLKPKDCPDCTDTDYGQTCSTCGKVQIANPTQTGTVPTTRAPIAAKPGQSVTADLGTANLADIAIPTSTSTQQPHLIIKALAGTGKTTTLVEGLRFARGQQPRIKPSTQQQAIFEALGNHTGSVCFCAFNKSIATELAKRLADVPNCEAKTLHSLGNGTLFKAFGRLRVNSYRVSDIIAELMERDIREIRRDNLVVLQATEKLVSLCKQNLVSSPLPEQLDNLCNHYDVDLNGSRNQVYDLVPRVLDRCKDVRRDKSIDFNDMIWLPVVLRLPVRKFDMLLVDEAQDLNRCQQALARMAGQRLVLCGDVHQAIYGFAGADSESLPRMERELTVDIRGCRVLPLTMTRRCGKAIVELAKQIVPDFEAHEDNPEGYTGTESFKRVGETQVGYRTTVRSGDMVLCRVNAPLVGQCFKFLVKGVKATIQGRDIGQGLIATVKKMAKGFTGEDGQPESLPYMLEQLNNWYHQERSKESAKRNPNEARLIGLEDRYQCILAFTQGASSVADVVSKIERLFTDNKEEPGIKFSSIHRAKGLEANNVYLLQAEMGCVPHPMAKSDWQRGQEMNLLYVARTRAIHRFIEVLDNRKEK